MNKLDPRRAVYIIEGLCLANDFGVSCDGEKMTPEQQFLSDVYNVAHAASDCSCVKEIPGWYNRTIVIEEELAKANIQKKFEEKFKNG